MLESNKIYFQDCLIGMESIENQSIDMILCDLPYGITSRNIWDSILPLDKLWSHYERIIKNNGTIILTAIQPFTSELVISNKKIFRYSLVWQKTTPTGFLNAKRMPLRIHEDILVFYKKLPTYNPQKTSGHTRKVSTAKHKLNCINSPNYAAHGLTTYDSTERYPTSILTFPTDKQKCALHPTQKPLALGEYLIKTYTNKDGLILDNCCGSGSFCLAAKNLNRNFIGFENNRKFFDIAVNRIGNFL